MRSSAQLLVVATAIITGALAQFYDGYENVTTATTPVQIRLAYQGPTAMMVSWNTFSQLTNPTVSYGISPDALTQTASSSVSVTYATSLTYNNHVNITGLLPYTTYYYLPQYSNASTPYTFTTARLAGDPTPYTVGVVVDMGTFGALGLSDVVGSGTTNPLRVNEQTTIAALTEMIDNYEFMIHAGDIAYADYWLKEEIEAYLPNTTTEQGAAVYEAILNAFFDEMINITSQKAYMVNMGNHEANCDNGGTTDKSTGQKYTESICLAGQTNFTGYINHWRMPSGPSGGLGNFWYSYDYGMAHFVHIDTETDLGNGLVGPDEGSPEYGGPFGSYNQQIDWLTNDLASVNRTLTPWVVVFGHRGWYISASSSVCPNCQTAFESIFYTYGVDLYINGHAHLYERTAPIYNGVIDPNGLNNPSATLYITNGAAGHYDGLDTFTAIQPYSVYREASDYAWSTISFTNSTYMTISTLWSANNTVFDTAILYKDHTYSSSTTTSSSSSSASTNPTTTTNTATTTSTAVYPTYTNFNGQGHLYVYSGGMVEGDIGSAGTWYNTPGQNVATYTAVPLYSNGTAFLLQHSTDYCTIGSDYSFGCAVTESSAATVFGQTADGNLTYNGSPAFYASSSASVSAKPTVYATPLAVSLNIVWGGTATSSSATTVETSSSTSSTTVPTSTSETSFSTISSTSFSSVSANSSTTGSATSSASAFNTAATVTVTQSITATLTQSASTSTVTATQVTTTTQTSSETDSITITQTTTATEIDSTTTTQTSIETDSVTVTQTTATTETDSTIETDSVTATQSTTVIETDSTTTTQPASTVTLTQPASTVTSTKPAWIVTITQPASTVTSTKPASTVTITQPASTVTSTKPASTVTTTKSVTAMSTVTAFVTSSTTTTVTTTKPASTVTVTDRKTKTVTITATIRRWEE